MFFFISFFTVANDANDFSCSCVHNNCIMIIDTESRTRWENSQWAKLFETLDIHGLFTEMVS